jgi:hypothetical protein
MFPMTIIFDEDKQKRKITDLLHQEEEDLVQILSGKYGIEYINLSAIPVNADALRLINEQRAKETMTACFAMIDKKVKIATRNPENEKVVTLVNELKEKGYFPELYITSTQSLEKAWLGYKDLSFAYESKAGSLEISNEEITKIIDEIKSLPQIIEILEKLLAST